MTRADIIRMAREAGFHSDDTWIHAERLERFAAMVAAAEREACAKVCESPINVAGTNIVATRFAAAIRARSQS